MQEMYLISPIIINELFQVIDGQHRLEACVINGLPVRFIKIAGYGLTEIQILNSNMRNWRKEDYLNGWCELKIPAYLKFKEFISRFPDLPFTSCMNLLSGSTVLKKDYSFGADVNSASKEFEDGKFVISDYNNAVEYAEIICQFREVYAGYNRKLFIMAITSFLRNPDFSYSEMIAKIKNNSSLMHDCGTVSSYKLLLEDIYNYRRHGKKISLRLD